MALYEAAKKQDMQNILKLQSEKGTPWIKARRDPYQNTILHIACDKGHKSLFLYAIKIGIDLNLQNIGN
jgi:ankyrin repeat protein